MISRLAFGAALAACAWASGVSGATTSYAPAYFSAAQPTSAMDMLALLPGFTFDKGDAVRGFGGAAGNVLVDGARPTSKDDSLDEVLKRIPASSVLRIDLIRGGAPGIDMQGKTILANIVRRPGGRAKATLALAGTSGPGGRIDGAARGQISARLGAFDLDGSFLAGQGVDDSAGDGSKTRTAAAGTPILLGRETGLGVGGNYKVTGGAETSLLAGKLRLTASLSHDPYRLTVDDALSLPAGREFELYTETRDTAEVGLRFERSFGPKMKSETVLLQQLGRYENQDAFTSSGAVAAVTGDDASDLFSIAKTTGESIARQKFTYAAGRSLSLEAGAEGDYNWLTARTAFLQDGAPVILPAADVHVAETRGEAFATATWSARRTLSLEAGLRLEASRIASTGDVVSAQTFVFPKPRAVLVWSPSALDQARLRVEREVGQLNFDDFAANAGNISSGAVRAGNPRLDPQQDWVFEAAYERRFWKGGDATITLRHHVIQDVIDRAPIYDPAGAFDAPGNIGSGRKDELIVNLTLPTDRLGVKRGILTGIAKFRDSRVIDPTTGAPRPISGVHANAWEAHFTQGLPALKSIWGLDALGQNRETYYRFDEIDTDKLKIFATLFAEYKPRSDLSIRVEVRNLGARGFEHARIVYGGPRNLDPLSYVDVRDLRGQRSFYLRILKTFN